jgi:hypothetical protein
MHSAVDIDQYSALVELFLNYGHPGKQKELWW